MIDGGMVSTPFIKNSSYVKVAFMNRGSDTIPPSAGIFPTHPFRQLVAIMSPEYSSTYSFLVNNILAKMQINITHIAKSSLWMNTLYVYDLFTGLAHGYERYIRGN